MCGQCVVCLCVSLCVVVCTCVCVYTACTYTLLTSRSPGTPYWIVRNSWGSFWGEGGWFRIIRGKKHFDLGITTDCVFGVPILP